MSNTPAYLFSPISQHMIDSDPEWFLLCNIGKHLPDLNSLWICVHDPPPPGSRKPILTFILFLLQDSELTLKSPELGQSSPRATLGIYSLLDKPCPSNLQRKVFNPSLSLNHTLASHTQDPGQDYLKTSRVVFFFFFSLGTQVACFSYWSLMFGFICILRNNIILFWLKNPWFNLK